MPTTNVSPSVPRTLLLLKRTPLACATAGSLASSSRVVRGIGEKPSLLRTVRSPAKARSTDRSIDPRKPAAKIVTNVTSARPIMSAAAVAAVRPGLRVAFSRARRPGMPPKRCRGAPTTLAIGGTSCGVSSAVARKMAAAPRPSRLALEPSEPAPSRPAATAPTPTTSRNVANASRMRPARFVGPATSRMAAIGGTRVARSAGTTLATTVTPIPTSSATTIVRAAMTVEPVGRSNPIALNSAMIAGATSRPPARPSNAAIVPTTSASRTTLRSTWRRLAPIVRSSASSFVRCATVIENVL
jgi:hypothetical protein